MKLTIPAWFLTRRRVLFAVQVRDDVAEIHLSETWAIRFWARPIVAFLVFRARA